MSDPRAAGAVLVSLVVTLGFIGTIYLYLSRPPQTSNEVAVVLMTALATNFGVVVNYWMGTSASSKAKDDTITQLTAGNKP